MNLRAIVRHIDGSKIKYDVNDVNSVDHAFKVIKEEDPNSVVTLLLIPGGKRGVSHK